MVGVINRQYKCYAVLEWGQCGFVGGTQDVEEAKWKFPPSSSSSVPNGLRSLAPFPRPKSGVSEGSTGEGVPRTQQKEERDEEEDNYDDNEDEEEDEEEGEGEGEEEEEDEEDEEREVEEVKGQVFSGFSFGVPRPDIKVAQNVVGGQNTAQPLTGLTFAQAGRLSESKRRIIQLVSSNGGVYTNSITNRVNYVLTTAAEVERGRRKIKTAQTLGVPIVVELLLHRLIANTGDLDTSPYQLQYKGPVGAGLATAKLRVRKEKTTRVPKPVTLKKKPIAIKAKKIPVFAKGFGVKKAAMKKPKSLPKAAKPFKPIFGTAAASPFGFQAKATSVPAPAPVLFPSPSPSPAPAPATATAPFSVFSGHSSPSVSGGAVDPEAKCPFTSKIFVDGSDVYNVMLNQTDITAGVNKYFKLQLIDVDGSASKFVFFAKWGRVGTDIGMSMKKEVTGKKAAIALFAEKYKDKAGNEWTARANFTKKPGKYFPVELEVDDTPAPSSVFGASSSNNNNNNALVPARGTSAPSQGRAKVDALSGHAHDAHVLEEQGVIYDAMLNQTNIGNNNNKFYVIQVLESNDNNTYWVWNRWGRVGEKGQSSLKASSKSGAIAGFKSKFMEKTKNNWDQRDHFKPHDGKYTLLKMEYEDPEVPLPDVPQSVKSMLDDAVQDLVNMIFDVRMMNQTLADLNIDVRKMPLGKISKSQILRGYDILTQIDNTLKQTGNRNELTMLSNQFYTLIPHDFGRKIPEMIDNVTLLKLKMKQMETLIEIQVASALLQEAAASGIHPTDAKYKKLGTKIEVLPRYSQDFEMIRKYLLNTYEPGDSPYTLELENVFVINRDGEEDRFVSHLDKQLLWHGSRLSNWISQGLRIAPPEAPKTGYMFGKGVYFGDMVAKSAEYCFTTPTSNTGLLLLSRVALGNSYELTQPQYMEQAPESYHSCHALAKTMPDPSDTGLMSDMVTKIPFGRGVPSNVADAFLSHGEYVVYDVAQINMKYLLRVKFHHK